jgi:hypothetical protein
MFPEASVVPNPAWVLHPQENTTDPFATGPYTAFCGLVPDVATYKPAMRAGVGDGPGGGLAVENELDPPPHPAAIIANTKPAAMVAAVVCFLVILTS